MTDRTPRGQSPLRRRRRDRLATRPTMRSTYLGIRADDQNDRGRGVRILDVYPGSPADKAGLRKQDLITAVAGVRVRQMTDMAEILDTFAPGQGVDFDLLRGGNPAEGAGDIGRTSGGSRAAIGPARGHSTAARRNGRQSPRVADRAAPPPPQSGGSPPTDASRIERLERRIDDLERRVAELERQLAEARQKGREP